MKRVISVLLALCLVFGGVAGAEEWTRVPMVSEEMLDHGMVGGEGCQWPQALEISLSDPNFMILGTDVSGVYKSEDGGKTWVSSMSGFYAHGCTAAVAIDPYNSKHILAVGGNSTVNSQNGIYLSMDGAETWQAVQNETICGYRDFRRAIKFDPTSYDEEKGYCMTAYWSKGHAVDKTYMDPALYKTTDGGYTWERLADSALYGEAAVAVNFQTGDVYLAGKNGYFKSTDGGATFTLLKEGVFTGVSVVHTRPNEVYLSTYNQLFISEDNGDSFEEISVTVKPVTPSEPGSINFSFSGYGEFTVSPTNPDYMVMCSGASAYNWYTWYSHDGGKSWYQSIDDDTFSFMMYNNRMAMLAFDPTDENTIFGFGGDWVSKSTDGGKVFRFSNDGNNSGAGSRLSFNIYEPNYVFGAMIDYNGGYSLDGGVSWHYANVSGYNWGGNCRGGYVVDEDYIIAVASVLENNVRVRYISESTDGGKTFVKRDDFTIESPLFEATYQSPNNPDILFVGEQRSTDRGKTWQAMKGCNAVLVHNYDPNGEKELYGLTGENNSTVVRSFDDGETWEIVANTGNYTTDLAYNWKENCVFTVPTLYRIDVETAQVSDYSKGLIRNQLGKVHARSVAVDPIEPNVMYVAGAGDTYVNDTSVQRSVNGGETWEVITRNPRNSVISKGFSGASEGQAVRVDPRTRYAYVGTNCFGNWKIGPPNTEEESGGPITAIQKEDGIHINWFGNGKIDISYPAEIAFNSTYNTSSTVPLQVDYDLNGSRTINENDLDLAVWHVFNEWDKELSEYAIYKSTDGVNFTELANTGYETEYVDSLAKSGQICYYRAKNLTDGSFSKTVKVVVK